MTIRAKLGIDFVSPRNERSHRGVRHAFKLLVWLASLAPVLGLAPSGATAVAHPGSMSAAAATTQPPDVILITIDTLRADHLGCYGDRQIQTPAIDALASTGARFTQARTPVPITLPAHTCILTGAFPMATGMHDFSGNKLSAKIPTLAHVLHDHGYSTAAFVSAAVLDSRFGLNQGFDTYYDHFDFSRLDETNLDLMERKGSETVDHALDWLKSNSEHRPLFLWVHLYDAHYPYEPPEPYASRYRTHPYDGGIAFDDAQVGRLTAFLEGNRLFDSSVIVLCADHGEGLGEHGEKTHGFFIYDSTLHIPLIIKVPGATPRVVNDNASLVDVMPTVLQALRVPIPPTVQGRSLLSLVMGQSGGAPSVLYSETYLPLLHFGWSQLQGLEVRGLQYIDAPRPELYNLRTDPHELRNLYSAQRAMGHELHDELYGDLRRLTPSDGNVLAEKDLTDPVLLDRLRSLGYVAVSAGTFQTTSGKALPDPKDRIHVYELFSEAMADGQHGRYQESLEKLAQAQKTETASVAIRYLEALDYYRIKDYARAVAKFQDTLQLDPKFALATYYLGLAHIETGDLDAAAAAFQRALALDSTNFSAAYNLGVVELKKNRPDDAVRDLRRAVEINPNYAQAYQSLGEIELYRGHADAAARDLEHAVQLEPDSAKAHLALGRAYQALGRQSDAERELAKARSQR